MLNGQVVHPALALLAYAVGVAVASYVTGKSAWQFEKVIWTRSVTLVIVAETVLAALAEWAWHAYRGGSHVPLEVLMAVMAACMGLQSGAMLQLRVPGVVTTYISGTLTLMVQGMTRLATGEREPKGEYEQRLEVQAVTLVVYLLSAILTGWLFKEAPQWVGMLPVVCLATVSVWSLLRGRIDAVAG